MAPLAQLHSSKQMRALPRVMSCTPFVPPRKRIQNTKRLPELLAVSVDCLKSVKSEWCQQAFAMAFRRNSNRRELASQLRPLMERRARCRSGCRDCDHRGRSLERPYPGPAQCGDRNHRRDTTSRWPPPDPVRCKGTRSTGSGARGSFRASLQPAHGALSL